jgi:hypothetical protein
MSTIADTALRSVVGLVVVVAMFIVIWVARDSSTRTQAATVEIRLDSPPLESARNDRAPVARTSLTREQLQALQATPAHEAQVTSKPR